MGMFKEMIIWEAIAITRGLVKVINAKLMYYF